MLLLYICIWLAKNVIIWQLNTEYWKFWRHFCYCVCAVCSVVQFSLVLAITILMYSHAFDAHCVFDFPNYFTLFIATDKHIQAIDRILSSNVFARYSIYISFYFNYSFVIHFRYPISKYPAQRNVLFGFVFRLECVTDCLLSPAKRSIFNRSIIIEKLFIRFQSSIIIKLDKENKADSCFRVYMYKLNMFWFFCFVWYRDKKVAKKMDK